MLYPPYPAELVQKYGFVHRARLCYLYTQSGKRLTDMYQEAGRAILGWEGGRARTVFKDVMNRGAVGSFVSEEAHRLEKAVQKLFPEYPFVRLYSGTTAENVFKKACDEHFLWRPWLGIAAGADAGTNANVLAGVDCVAFLPPFPLAHDCLILASRGEHALQSDIPADANPLASCILAAITRSIYDLILELPARKESGWSAYDAVLANYWTRTGPYLFPKIARTDYREFATTCLDAGLVISPDYDIPSIIPWQANIGDIGM